MPDSVTMPLPPDPMREAVDQVEQTSRRVILTRDGTEVAAIVPMEDLRALEEMDELEDAYWAKAAAAAIADWEARGRPPGIPMEDVARELGIDLNDLE